MTPDVTHYLNSEFTRRLHTLLFVDKRHTFPYCTLCRREMHRYKSGVGRKIRSFKLPHHTSVCQGCYTRYRGLHNDWPGLQNLRSRRRSATARM